jgi:hypothetical protein
MCIPASAFAQAQIGLRVGIDQCMDNGDAECEDTKLGYSVTLAPKYMFNPNVGIGLDVNFSSLTAEGENQPDIDFFHVIPMVTGVFNAGAVDFSLGAGIGYNRLKISQGIISVEPNTWMAFKASLGLMIPVDDQLSVALGIDYVFNGEMELCIPIQGGEKCAEGDMFSQLHIAAGINYSF